MTDEKTTQQTEQPKQNIYVYYWSNKDIPFNVIYSPIELPNQFPLTKDAPDPSYKNPVYDWQKMVWTDSNEENQGKQLAEMRATVAQLQKTAQANSEEKDKLTTALDNMQKSQMQLTQMLSAMMNSQTGVPTAPAPTQQAENGGTK